jgi:hypothetical protein
MCVAMELDGLGGRGRDTTQRNLGLVGSSVRVMLPAVRAMVLVDFATLNFGRNGRKADDAV